MPIKLFDHQALAIESMKPGSILCGGVGSGKSITALVFYYKKICGGKIKTNGEGGFSPMRNPKNLYVITTARKRDTLEWERECAAFLISKDPKVSINGVRLTVDSWNNIGKYTHVKDSFFIFDEQRLVGSGSWSKHFLKIVKNNLWILLSATPGDTWTDYVPVFIANGFFKNRTDFFRKHVVYKAFSKFPKIDHYVNCENLIKMKKSILVDMIFQEKTISHYEEIFCPFDTESFKTVLIKRWNVYKDQPIRDVSELCHTMRRVVNSSISRLNALRKIIKEHEKIIVFYNFDYELEILRQLKDSFTIAEWNGHKHESIPETDSWIYLVQYTSGAEGWNCITTNAIVFYSQNYSYKIMTQAAGRINRINTPFTDLWYYTFKSNSVIDSAITKALKNKKDFNESRFMNI